MDHKKKTNNLTKCAALFYFNAIPLKHRSLTPLATIRNARISLKARQAHKLLARSPERGNCRDFLNFTIYCSFSLFQLTIGQR